MNILLTFFNGTNLKEKFNYSSVQKSFKNIMNNPKFDVYLIILNIEFSRCFKHDP